MSGISLSFGKRVGNEREEGTWMLVSTADSNSLHRATLYRPPEPNLYFLDQIDILKLGLPSDIFHHVTILRNDVIALLPTFHIKARIFSSYCNFFFVCCLI